MTDDIQDAPRLTTTLTNPYVLEAHFLKHQAAIEAWFSKEWKKTVPPVYGSVDLRNAGFKLAPIDMNLFPAGFNNLNPAYLSYSVVAAKKIIHQLAPSASRILVITESHTRNLFYWANIKTLEKILMEAQFQVRFGILLEEVKAPQDILLPNGESIKVWPLIREGDQLKTADFTPNFILLNNDLSEGIPEIIQSLSQPVIPPATLGWSQRLKSEHFQYYQAVAAEFSAHIGLDPWFIAPLFRHCGQIDFMAQDGMECLKANAEMLFEEIRKKYQEYNIPYDPFLIVKADAGTYGMAVMTVRNINELITMNRKQRTRMSTTKGGQPVSRVIIQEGIYTFETVGVEQSVAEPVVYLWGETVVGGFYRVHKDRGVDESLNSPGMHFEPLPFTKTCHEPCAKTPPNACQNRFYAYGVVAMLSMLAAAREMKDQIS